VKLDPGDNAFAGSIPALYQSHLVPLIFEPYATDLAERLQPRSPSRILEVAAGTGVATRAMARLLPPTASIVATDLNQAMLDQAAAAGTARAVTWRQADARHLPFPDGAFDAVVCQFGVMFFPDKAGTFSEARRVLRRGGVLLFSVWDTIEQNEFANTVTTALEALFPEDPPRFMARTPHGYHDRATISADLAAAGFERQPVYETVTKRSKAASARDPAIAYCQGTPLRTEIEARDAEGLERATMAAAQAIEQQFGSGPVDGRIQACIVTAEV